MSKMSLDQLRVELTVIPLWRMAMSAKVGYRSDYDSYVEITVQCGDRYGMVKMDLLGANTDTVRLAVREAVYIVINSFVKV